MKKRLDVLLVEKGLFTSREQARAAIMAGEIRVDDVKVDKAGAQIKEEANLVHIGAKIPFVSRGGLKLAKAVEYFNLDFTGMAVLDIGASTGGFTDCALQNGARIVYAVDVGYGQIAWKLRTDERVVVLEKTNARYLTEKEIPEPIDFITTDASFISLEKLLPAASSLMKDHARGVVLIKPQFEAGKEKVGKKGVVRDKAVHLEVIENVFSYARSNNLAPIGLTNSPIKGPEGNIEYLLYLEKNGEEAEFDINKLVDDTFSLLDK